MNIKILLYKIFGFFALSYFLNSISCKEFHENHPFLSLPTPKIEQLSDSSFSISKLSLVVYGKYLTSYQSSILSIKNTIATYGLNKGSKAEVVFQLVTDSLNTIPQFIKYFDQAESYAIQFSDQKIIIQSKSEPGLLNGLTTLEYFIIKNQGKLQQGLIIDYPDIKNRVLHIRLLPGDLKTYKNTIRLARFSHYNTIILLLYKGVKLKSIEHWEVKGMLSQQEFKGLVNYAKENGLEVIPELKLLSHQHQFFGEAHPEFMFNKNTYNPLNKEVYKYVFAAIDEIVELTGTTKLHIGHDEVAGYSKKQYERGVLREGESQLPVNLFFKDVITINDYLNSKNIETWMWGDMLLSDEQFPSLNGMRGIHGYDSDLINKLPKNITICDWHYNDTKNIFPSTEILAKAEFKVYGVTWENKETIRKFSKYVTTMPDNVKGMIATTWYRLNGPKKELAIDIINYSGETFWNAKE